MMRSEYRWGNCSDENIGGKREFTRLQQGLCGPIRICTEEIIYSAETLLNGEQVPERRLWSSTEYDLGGRLLNKSWREQGGAEWAVRRSYGTFGPVLESKFKDGVGEGEYIFDYSVDGRLQSITDSSRPKNPMIFQYAANGYKAKIQTSRADDYIPVTSSRRMGFADMDRPPNLQGGGSAVTTYDEHDRPTTIEVRDSNGDLVRKAMRSYDEQGRITLEKITVDDMVTLVPESIRETILESRDGLREQLTQAMGGQANLYSVSYRYDSERHLRLATRRVFNHSDQIETTYNEFGDPIMEITKRTEIVECEGSTPQPQISETAQSYKYDQTGNWTERLSSRRSNPDHKFKLTTKATRTLSYF